MTNLDNRELFSVISPRSDVQPQPMTETELMEFPRTFNEAYREAYRNRVVHPELWDDLIHAWFFLLPLPDPVDYEKVNWGRDGF